MSAVLAACQAAPTEPARRFLVCICDGEGRVRAYERVGGSSLDHVLEAITLIGDGDPGFGARISVRQLEARHG